MDRDNSQTARLLRVIGSPFVAERERPSDEAEALSLYELAKKNKSGIFYLTSLKERDLLEPFSLQGLYEAEKDRYDKQWVTAVRISRVLNAIGCDYAIIKSIMPYPATPNDVDIIHFGSDEEYDKAVVAILASNYTEIKGEMDAEQKLFHDLRECAHADMSKKDMYDVDLYQQLSASHILYMDKNKLRMYAELTPIRGEEIRVLNPNAEHVLTIVHSIIPEMLQTLMVYYTTLYLLSRMTAEDVASFYSIARENHVLHCVRMHLSIVGEVHASAHGTTPPILDRLIEIFGEAPSESRILLLKDLKMPHKYGMGSIVKILFEKMNEPLFRRSLYVQMRHMARPRYVYWFVKEMSVRRRRETY
ncbi:MAG TPA: hypothetical protein VE134_08295 [Methanomicrobiales archaeon]|nr:hypothetical protein [Methanomicrobiales archaeon]